MDDTLRREYFNFMERELKSNRARKERGKGIKEKLVLRL